jgi:serine/threonine protein kinase
MISGRYPFPASTEDGILEDIFTVLGPITMEQVRDIGVDPLLYPELLVGSTFNARRWSDIQVFPKTPSVELRALLNQCLEYSPRRRADAATILRHNFFKSDEEKNVQEL